MRPQLIMTLAVLLSGPSGYAATRPPKPGTGEIKVAQQGLDLLMDGDIDAAIKVFHAIRADHPESPLGDLLEADAIWWKIYLTTGNLVDPDVFEVGPNSASA